MCKFKYFIIAVAAGAALLATACHDDYETSTPLDPAVYIDAAESKPAVQMTFKKSITEQQKRIKAKLVKPVAEPVSVTFDVDATLVETYNARHDTEYAMLGKEYYAFSQKEVQIEPEAVESAEVVIDFTKLDQLEINVTYLLPVTIKSASIDILDASGTVWYLVKRSSAITMAARLVDNWFEFPTLDKKGPQSDLYNGLTAVTYEAIIRIEDFKKHGEISSIMGVEQYLLLRIGDADFNRQQLQFDGSGDGAGFGKFPEKDNSKILLEKEWYHVACSYDQKTRQVRIYVNGKLQSAADDVGSSTPAPINLAMRALYDANPEVNKAMKEAYQFFIGRSYDDNRQLNGDIAEVRVWNVARSEEEIWTSMYDVDPKTPGLIGYWKFNEGEGDTVPDLTGNGNDAVAHTTVVWPDGIEIPQLNQEQ